MPSDILTEVDLSALPDLKTVLPCEGIRYVHPNGEPYTDECPHPGEWTRLGHCSVDSVYCTICKEEVTSLARYGWVSCRECSTIIWPEKLNWRRL